MNYTLSRVPYLLLGFIVQFVGVSLISQGDEKNLLIGVGVLLVFPLLLAIPRARDCGWPPWLGLLTLIPVLGIVPAVALLFGPTRMGLFEKEGEEDPAEPPEGPSLP